MSGEFEPPSVEEVFEVPEFRDTSPQIRGAFRWMDTVDVEELFRTRAVVLRSVPHFLRGPFRIALRTALAEVIATEHVRRVCGWKLFLHRSLQAALIALDHWNVEDTFKQRASVMKVVPKFLRGSYRLTILRAKKEVGSYL